MARTAKSFGRAKAFLKQIPRTLVICEDSKGGLRYLEDAKVYFRVAADVEIAHVGHTDPRGIVTHAISRQSAYDSVYCVIDRDTHETFDEAVQTARRHPKIHLIVSYPSFEYWLFLHFQYSRRAYNQAGKLSPGAQMLNALREIPVMEQYEKSNKTPLFSMLLEKLPTARANSLRSLNEALELGQMNPSSAMHELLNEFQILAKPQPSV